MIQPLKIPESEYTPLIEFDPVNSTLKISGVSRPENVIEFYNPLLSWLLQYIELIKSKKIITKSLVVNFHLSYFNTSSAKYLTDFLTKIKKLQAWGIDLTINWYYSQNDDNALEDGEDLSFSTDMVFNYIAIRPT